MVRVPRELGFTMKRGRWVRASLRGARVWKKDLRQTVLGKEDSDPRIGCLEVGQTTRTVGLNLVPGA